MNSFKVIDLSRTFELGMPQPLSLPRFGIWTCSRKKWGDQVNCNALMLAEHVGTNCDAPFHALENGKKIDELEVDAFVGNGIKFDFFKKEENSVISEFDIKEQERDLGINIEKNDIVLLRTGFDDKYWGNNPLIAKKLKNRPSLGLDAAQYFVSKKIKAVGMDTGSPDVTGTNLPVHQILLSNNILIIETLTNLAVLPTRGFFFVALPLKIKGGSGSPVRAAAIIFN